MKRTFFLQSTIVCLTLLFASIAGAEPGVWMPKSDGLYGVHVNAISCL